MNHVRSKTSEDPGNFCGQFTQKAFVLKKFYYLLCLTIFQRIKNTRRTPNKIKNSESVFSWD